MVTIALLSDFGTRDTYVAEIKAVLMAPEKFQIVDLTHQVPAFDVDAGAFQLWRSYRHFPAGTAFLCVVDPGVGTDRRAIYVRTKRFHFVGPDNGLMTWAIRDIEALEGTAKYFQITTSNTLRPTFHGRDLFAPFLRDQLLAMSSEKRPARLNGLSHGVRRVLSISGGSFPLETHSGKTRSGTILMIDHYGNLITNLTATDPVSHAELGKRQIRPAANYSSISPGEFALIPGSHGLWEVATRESSAAERLGAKKGDPVKIFRL